MRLLHTVGHLLILALQKSRRGILSGHPRYCFATGLFCHAINCYFVRRHTALPTLPFLRRSVPFRWPDWTKIVDSLLTNRKIHDDLEGGTVPVSLKENRILSRDIGVAAFLSPATGIFSHEQGIKIPSQPASCRSNCFRQRSQLYFQRLPRIEKACGTQLGGLFFCRGRHLEPIGFGLGWDAPENCVNGVSTPTPRFTWITQGASLYATSETFFSPSIWSSSETHCPKAVPWRSPDRPLQHLVLPSI